MCNFLVRFNFKGQEIEHVPPNRDTLKDILLGFWVDEAGKPAGVVSQIRYFIPPSQIIHVEIVEDETN